MSGDTRDTGPDTQPSTQPGAEPAGQQQSVAGAARPSYGDLLTAPLTKQFAKFSGGVYAAVAVGVGVMFLALKYLGKPAVTATQGAEMTGNEAAIAATNFVNTSANLAIYALPLLAAAVAAYLGVYAARELDVSDRKLFVAAGVGSLVGAFVFVVLASYMVSLGFGTAATEGGSQAVSKPGSVDVGNVVFNAVAVAIGAGVLTLGTAWTDRSLV